MDLSNLTYLVVSCEMAIKKAKEQKENAVFEYCKEQGFETGKRYIYHHPGISIDGKMYEVILNRPTDCRMITNCIDGARVFIKCYPVKKDGSRALIGETELYINDLKAV